MSYQFEIDGEHAVLSGDLTIYTVGEIKTCLSKALQATQYLEIDLSGVTEIDTAGLQLMLLAKRKPGTDVCFVHHSAAALRLVDLANLGRTLGDPLLVIEREEAL